jgi:hypothetical protein
MNIFNRFVNSLSSRRVNPFWKWQNDSTQYINIRNKEEIFHAYNACSTLKSIINHTSEVFSRGQFYIEKDGKIDDNKHYLLDFFSNTSILQNNTFKFDYATQIQLYGICVILKRSDILVSKKDSKNALILEFERVTINVKDEYKTIKSLKDVKNIYEIIKDVDYINSSGQEETFAAQDVIIISNTSLKIENKELTCNHKLISAEQDVNILVSAKEVRIYYNRKRGGAFLISKKPLNAGVNETVMNRDGEEEQFKKALNSQTSSNKTGEGTSTVFTNQPYDAKPISRPVNTLGLEEGIKSSKASLCDLTNFPKELLNNIEGGSTYDNKTSADKQLITNSIIPMFKNFDEKVNNYFELEKKEIFITDYSHFEALQPDKKTRLEAENIETNMIIELNREVKAGNITKDIAVDILVYNYEYTEETAKKRIIKIS